ncbi:MAG: hypothetical protein KGI38_02400 [Thaumarchaeota archaeon]|nr:hypothetical protein [Nitrososphaerota archaeon]
MEHADIPAKILEDPRIKFVEYVTTLGGLLGIVISLLQGLLVDQAKTGLATFFVLFVVFSLLAYATLVTHRPPAKVKLALGAQSAAFSGLIVFALTIPLSNATVGIAIQSISYIGVWGAILVYIAIFLVFVILLYVTMVQAMMRISDQIAPH